MKRLSLTILCCFLLSGCIFDPTFDTSSWDAYQRSLATIKAKLSNDDLRRLEIALGYLLIESMPRAQINAQPLSTMSAAANLANPYLVLARLGPRINGWNAAAVIRNLALKLDTEIQETEGRTRNVENVFGTVEVLSPSYSWQSSLPVVEFAVRNEGKAAISRIQFRTVLTSPGRSVPWATQEFVQTFKGGLEPREKRQLTFQPTYGNWNDPQLKDVYNTQLKVMVMNFEDANGERATAVDTDALEMKRKVRAALQ